ncbi:hypothetical protein [Hymenobacter algoricola]
MKQLFGLSLLLSGALAGFQPGQPEQSETQQAAQMRTQVLALHDSTMLHREVLTSERQRLEQRFRALDTTWDHNATRAARLRHLRGALVAADTTMMHWLHTYQEPGTALLTNHQHVNFWTAEEQNCGI